MEFLKAYLGALGGTATLLLLVGFFGRTLIEQWFKKDYKEWESQLEQRLKEDFKHYEDKLDAIATRDETRFNYRFINGADACKEIFKLANEAQFFVPDVISAKLAPAHARTPEFEHVFKTHSQNLHKAVSSLQDYARSVKYLLPYKVNRAIHSYYSEALWVSSCEKIICPRDSADMTEKCIFSLLAMESAFRDFLEGSEKEKSIPD